jgi:CubicO group peptidase (beta-lactamase class C family)
MLEKFIDFARDKKLKVDSIIITAEGKRHSHTFGEDKRRNVRSLSKTVSCLGAYKAIESGLFQLSSPVMSFFDDVEIYNKPNLEHLPQLKIEHLLTLTVGYEKGLMLGRDYTDLPAGTNYLSYILNTDINHEPGTCFIYNNGATYLLSSIIQRQSGMRLDQWIYEKVLKYLDIDMPEWEISGQGICLGATGLQLNNEEIHKIGLLLLNRGDYMGNQLIGGQWVDSMHKPHILNPAMDRYSLGNKMNKIAYGYNIWVCGDGSEEYPNTHYYCDGADGQFLIVSPEKNMVVTVLSEQRRTAPLYDIIGQYL